MNHFNNDAFVESCKIPKKSKFDLFPVCAVVVVGMPCDNVSCTLQLVCFGLV